MPRVLHDSFLFASTNQGKFQEVSLAAGRLGLSILSPSSLPQKGPPPDVDENAGSYEGNCLLKASAFFHWSGLPSLADDTGLEVAALNGAPGVHSARYAGIGAPMPNNIEKLLGQLEGIEENPSVGSSRGAKFVCHLVLVRSDSSILHSSGELKGSICQRRKGSGGFGYDSIFVVDGYGKTLAELKEQGVPVKTHRIAALEKMAQLLDAS